ncbi:hypothetical protein C2S53_012242 [Perilla frutescens var. hirtella]|uniref:Uncharacterized protein n=1 Tax=Perilla frutescens var. hirtella TaxID=608512 RepID=A0AAD4J3N8_PERFH|nr:hypothetical protein C2S53_012242 [Perilla frutescens var. hirtella]
MPEQLQFAGADEKPKQQPLSSLRSAIFVIIVWYPVAGNRAKRRKTEAVILFGQFSCPYLIRLFTPFSVKIWECIFEEHF